MHADEIATDVSLVRRLLAAQFPQWADLSVRRVASSGTVNALYRLGNDMVVRVPRRIEWSGGINRDLRWLPELAPLLPVAVPVPLAKGVPAEGYPCEWGIYGWLEGDNPTAGSTGNTDALAMDLVRFIRALRAVGAGPPGARGTFDRWDQPTRTALAELEGTIDTRAATAAWEDAIRSPAHLGPPVWTHGDLMPANLLVRDGALAGVIDWECAGLADPACDLAVAWNLLTTHSRRVFREELGVDDQTWARGRGWALCTGLVALPYYRETNPELAENARYRIEEVLADR